MYRGRIYVFFIGFSDSVKPEGQGKFGALWMDTGGPARTVITPFFFARRTTVCTPNSFAFKVI